MRKKSAIGTVFVYAISAIIIVLVFYFGYRGIAGFQKANQDSIAEKMQLRMKADMSELSMHYGSSGRFNYDAGSYFTKICFVDLNLNQISEGTRNSALENYPLILDSITESSSNNAFGTGERFVAFDVGKLKVQCSPYFFCANVTNGKVSFYAEGGGDSVVILCK